MRKRRRSWLLAVHRWLFYFAVFVVVVSALSRLDEETAPRVVDAHRQSSNRGDGPSREERAADERPLPFIALAGCP